ncbi:MAG: TIR domain-containing protein, partial [Acidobacteria bacterium]|nr:TIR domain-containing protein [Acidobacteriota bacterium]
MTKGPDFDVALSFAGEDRAFVDEVANRLRERGVKVFYDLFEETDLWGKDLYAHLTDVYQHRARYTVIFISEAYSRKLWTNHERRAAQARAFQEAQEYILPVRVDETEIPGVLVTTGYVSLAGRSPEDLVSLITKKLVTSGGSVPTELVRRDYSTVAIAQIGEPTMFRVVIADDEGDPIPGCSITAQAENGTTLEARTDDQGVGLLQVPTRRTHRLLISHADFPATIVERVDPAEEVRVTVPRSDNIGSAVFHSTGYIPGLAGRLNPIRDGGRRMYMYADNIAIDGRKDQPATIEL